MFCANCGNRISDTSLFCPHCGTRINQYKEDDSIMHEKKVTIWDIFSDSAVKKRLLIIGCICAIIVLVIMVFSFLFFYKPYEKPVEYLEKVMEENDVEALIELFPEKMICEISEKTGYNEEAIENEIIYYLKSQIDCNKGIIQLEYEIRNVRAVTVTELQEINEQLEYYMDNIKISDAKELAVQWTVDVNGDSEGWKSVLYYVIKVNGKWYMIPELDE